MPTRSHSRFPEWPPAEESNAGVIDEISEDGIRGWILDFARPETSITYLVMLGDIVVGEGRTELLRPDITAHFPTILAPGFLFEWENLTKPQLLTLYEGDRHAELEIYVPSLDTLLAKHSDNDTLLHFNVDRLKDLSDLYTLNLFVGPQDFYENGLPQGQMVLSSKRICLITTEFHGLFKNGGIGTANTGLAMELAAEGWNVSVLYIDCDDNGPRTRFEDFEIVAARYRSSGITLEYLPRYPEIFEQFLDIRRVSFAIYKFVCDKEYSALFFNECGGQGFHTVMAKRAGALPGSPKICVVTHGPNDWTHELNSQQWSHQQLVVLSYMEKKCVQHADFVVSPSAYLLSWMKERGWKLPALLFVEQNIVPLDETTILQRHTAAPRKVAEFVFFGRQEVRKGVKLFCEALDLLVQQGIDLSSIGITFLGKMWKVGEMNSAAYILLRSVKWGARVHFLSNLGQSEANEYLQGRGRLAVIPSLAENSPCVVAECLGLGIPFVATSSGGTPELVAKEDRSLCLVPPNPRALAKRLSICLRDGQGSCRMATDQALTRKRWRKFLVKSDESRASPLPENREIVMGGESDFESEPLVSVCLVHYDRPLFLRQAFESVLEQSYRCLELVIVDDGSRSPSAVELLKEIEETTWQLPVRVVRQSNKYLGAARNAATRHASGDYFLFVDDDNLLMKDAVRDLVRAAKFFQADIITGVPLSFYHRQRPNIEFDGEIRTLPLGGCLEVGFIENCFGDANALVSRHAHQVVGGFHEVHGEAVEDWEFFAKATLNGLTVEVLPKPTFWYRVLESGMFVKSDPVANARRIAKVYSDHPLGNVSRMLELLWDISRQNRFRLLQTIAQSAESRDTLLELASLDPDSNTAKRMLIKFMVEQRRIQEAFDYAFHNEISLVEHATLLAREAIAEDARGELIRYEAVVKDTLDVSAHVCGRAEALYGVNGHLANVGECLNFAVTFDTAVVRAEKICPTGADSMDAKCWTSGQFIDYEACLVACPSGTEIDLEGEDLSVYPGVHSSCWMLLQPNEEFNFHVDLRSRKDVTHDIFLIVRGAERQSGTCELSWSDFRVELSRGSSSRSVIRPRYASRRLSERTIATKGQLITTNKGDLEFSPFSPGYPSTLHPIHDGVTTVRVPRIIPPGAVGARVTVSVVSEKAHPIQFGIWLHPNSQPLGDETHLVEASFSGGWLTVVEKNIQKAVQVVLSEAVSEPHDLYVASRVVGQQNVWFCHALIHDAFVLFETE